MTETAILPESESTISDTPPETAFRKRYNDHLEMPTSIIGSICIHVAIVFALIFVLFRLIDGPVKPIIPIVMVDQGEDEEGKGNPETGKAPETLAKGTNAPTSDDLAKLNLPSTLPRKNEIQDQLRVDSAEADIKMPESDQLAYAVLDKHLSDKLLGIGQHNIARG